MALRLNFFTVFGLVTVAALVGMVMGGLFGLGAGNLAPDLLSKAVPWDPVQPVGTAIVLGATAGVLLGGGLGVFGVIVQLIYALLRRK